jgi:hypothetical protein
LESEETTLNKKEKLNQNTKNTQQENRAHLSLSSPNAYLRVLGVHLDLDALPVLLDEEEEEVAMDALLLHAAAHRDLQNECSASQ